MSLNINDGASQAIAIVFFFPSMFHRCLILLCVFLKNGARILRTRGDEEENKLSYKREYKYIFATFKCVKSCHTWQIKTFRGNLVFESHLGTNAWSFAFVRHIWDSGQLGHFRGACFKFNKKVRQTKGSGDLGLLRYAEECFSREKRRETCLKCHFLKSSFEESAKVIWCLTAHNRYTPVGVFLYFLLSQSIILPFFPPSVFCMGRTLWQT